MEPIDLSKLNKQDLLAKCKELNITTSKSKYNTLPLIGRSGENIYSLLHQVLMPGCVGRAIVLISASNPCVFSVRQWNSNGTVMCLLHIFFRTLTY